MELPIRTERLVLRALDQSDLAEHLRLFSIPSVVRYLYDTELQPDAAMEHLAKRFDPDPTIEDRWCNLAVTLDGVYIGEVGLNMHSHVHRCVELGWVFFPEVAGNGYATEAAAAMRDYAFTELDAHRCEAHFDFRNKASIRVAERLGMTLEAHIRENEWIKDEWSDEGICGMLRSDWVALRGSSAS